MDELSLIDHSEIMARLTLKQEVGTSQVLVQSLAGDEGEGLLGEWNLEVYQVEESKWLLGCGLCAPLPSWLSAPAIEVPPDPE